MSALLDFLTLSDPNVRFVVGGSVLLGAGAGLTGVFTFLRKRALIGDAVAHSILPGICLAYLLGGKSPWVLFAGAVVSGWLSLAFMDLILRRTKLKEDAATGIALSAFFGLGILLLTAIQHSGSAGQSGLDKFLFGKAASMTAADTWSFGLVALILLLASVLFYKPFQLLAFDAAYARAIGLPTRWLEFLLSTLTVFAVAMGIQAVGVVLMAALLITPAASARFWTDRLPVMMVLSAAFGMLAAWVGAGISYTAPAMATGPWIVLTLTALAAISVGFAPKRGIFARWVLRRRNASKILEENLLKAIYQIGEAAGDWALAVSREQLLAQRDFEPGVFQSGMSRLVRRSLLQQAGHNAWTLTPSGLEAGKRVVRLHRLWEAYLYTRLRLPADHVHHAAEAMEHVLTPEMEEQILLELDHPGLDPHRSPIPK